jgi:hypothetical protein
LLVKAVKSPFLVSEINIPELLDGRIAGNGFLWVKQSK